MRPLAFVRTGDLDRRMRIEYPVSTPDAAYGTPVITWEALATIWANVQDALPSRSEAVTQGLVVARNQTRIRLRWRDDIDSSMRIVDVATEDVYQIIGGPAMLGRRQFIEVQCERYDSLVATHLWLWADVSEIVFEDDSSVAQG